MNPVSAPAPLLETDFLRLPDDLNTGAHPPAPTQGFMSPMPSKTAPLSISLKPRLSARMPTLGAGVAYTFGGP